METVERIQRRNSSPETGEAEDQDRYWEPSPLHSAVYRGDLPRVEQLLDGGSNINMLQHGITPLHLSVAVRNGAITSALLARNCDINAADLDREVTPLHRAACAGYPEQVRLLLDKGADINARAKSLATPLYYATDHNHLDTMAVLLARGAAPDIPVWAGVPPITRAALNGYHQAVTMLLAHGATVNTVDRVGNTPLLCAVDAGQVRVTRDLIQAGAEVNVRKPNGDTPLSIAALHGHGTLVDILLQAGSHQQMAHSVYLATRRQHVPVVQRLAEAGGDLDVRDDESGETPLIEAIKSRSPSFDLLRTLIQNGCDVDKTGSEGYTPLEVVCIHSKKGIIEMLIRADCTPHLRGSIEQLGGIFPRVIHCINRRKHTVKTLKSLCRMYIRRYLGFGKNYKQKVAELDVATELHHFLTFMDI